MKYPGFFLTASLKILYPKSFNKEKLTTILLAPYMLSEIYRIGYPLIKGCYRVLIITWKISSLTLAEGGGGYGYFGGGGSGYIQYFTKGMR